MGRGSAPFTFQRSEISLLCLNATGSIFDHRGNDERMAIVAVEQELAEQAIEDILIGDLDLHQIKISPGQAVALAYLLMLIDKFE